MQASWEEVVEITRRFNNIQLEHWLNDTLFTFNWWILLTTTVVLFLVWLIILDKKRIFEITTYGFMVAFIGVIADMAGVFLMLWQYKHTLTPLTIVVEIHTILMPVIYMIIYQYFHTWKSFITAVTIQSFIFAFILEPLLVWLQIYELFNWKHIYSFIPYIIIAVVLKGVINKLKQKYG
ncbi:CBO0543 family protein [Ornithinibacillus scapharcae]|uniref:CBO0543 family protein n=1 Tax=Ornithinibacillus scapharcae TaxID=1147159 RepID=UPI000225B81E|nr:CBO0543 family protein [Ornithinibacillus scapharcae]